MKYLKERQFYEDRYDLHTIKECLNLQTNFKAALLSHRNELLEMSDEDFNLNSEYLIGQLLLIFQGERFKSKEMVIREWIIKDKERDHQYENAMQPVGVKCRNCSSPMRVINKELHENKGNPKVLFFYECMKCKKRRNVFEDGNDFINKEIICPTCKNDLSVWFSRTSSKLTTRYFCRACSFSREQTEDMNIYKPKTNRKQEKERLLLLRYRDEFCLGNDKGGSYLRTMSKLKPLIDPERKRK